MTKRTIIHIPVGDGKTVPYSQREDGLLCEPFFIVHPLVGDRSLIEIDESFMKYLEYADINIANEWKKLSKIDYYKSIQKAIMYECDYTVGMVEADELTS